MAVATKPTRAVDQLVVVGSSAGGIEALSVLVGSLPADLPAAVVIAQHLDPDRPSHLGAILARLRATGNRRVRTSTGRAIMEISPFHDVRRFPCLPPQYRC